MRIYLYIFFLLGVSSSALAQKPRVELTADTKIAEVGDPVMITVKSNIQGIVNIDFPDEFVMGTGMANVMEQEMDYNTGKVTTYYYFSQNGVFTEEKEYTFKAYIKKGKTYQSNALTIRVHKQEPVTEEISRKNLRQPVFGIIERSKPKIYEGEPLILSARIYSKLDIEKVQGYDPFELDIFSEIFELDNSKQVYGTEEMVKGVPFYSYNCGRRLLFPAGTGKFSIKPYEMAFWYYRGGEAESISFTSNPSSVEIIPLPVGAPRDFTGGVGSFEFSRSINKSNITQGDVVTMTITVSGYGNLHNIRKPFLKLPKGLAVYGDPEIVEDISYGVQGSEGKITYTYNIQVLHAGDIDLPALSMSYFDPAQKKYITLQEKRLAIAAAPSNNLAASLPVTVDKKDNEQMGLSALKTRRDQHSNNHFLKTVWFWTTILSPMALAFLGGVFFTRRKNRGEKVTDQAKYKQDMAGIEDLFNQAEDLRQNAQIQAAFGLIQQALLRTATLVTGETTVVSKSEIQTGFQGKGIATADIAQFQQYLLICEEARYTFIDQSDRLKSTLTGAQTLTREILHTCR
jgi:hypothetical protein